MFDPATPSVNVERAGTSAAAVAKYEREIMHLRQELAMHDVLAGRSGVKYGALGEEEHNWVAKTTLRAHMDSIRTVHWHTNMLISAGEDCMLKTRTSYC